MDDFDRSYEEKRDALVVKDCLPVAVKDLYTLNTLGKVTPIPGVCLGNAVLLDPITHPVLKDFIPQHIWVNPKYRGYKGAWRRAGFKAPSKDVTDLDHLHSRAWAQSAGYGYVILVPISSGPNRSAGTLEKKEAEVTLLNYSNSKPIFYGNHIHWAKLWQLKIDLMRE